MFEVSFVDSISATAGLRLSLSGNGLRAVKSGTDFGMPELHRAVVSNLMVDGETYPAAAYGNRVITLALDATHLTNPDDAAAQIQKLMREVDRAENFLRYRPDTTNPVYFRTFRSSLSRVQWDGITKRGTATIVARPFAFGEKVTLNAVTVNNDPAAVSNGMFWDVTGVAGDVETPALIRIDNTTPFNAGVLASVLAVRRRGTPSAMPLVLQCESMSQLTDTTFPGNDTAMSGAGSNYARCSFATTQTVVARVKINNWPAAPSVDARGRYRVWVRCRQTVATDVMQLGVGFGAPGMTANILNDLVTLPTNTTNLRWIDLGDLSMPVFGDPVDDGGVQLPIVGLGIQLRAARVSGTGNLDLDCILLMPADDTYCSMLWTVAGTQVPGYLMLDGVKDAVYPMDVVSGVQQLHSNGGGIPRTGGLPMLYPNQTNRICMIMNASPPGQTNLADDKTHTANVVLSYYPRYISVRPVGS